MVTSRMAFVSVFTFLFLFFGVLDKTYSQKVEIGVTGGINVSSHLTDFQYSEEDIQLQQLNPHFTPNYQAGLILRKKLSNTSRMQLEPSLIFLGASYDQTFMLRGHELETNSSTELLYFHLPIVFQLSTATPQYTVYGSDIRTTTFHISGGLFGAYLLDAQFSGVNRGTPLGIRFEREFSNDVTSHFSNFDAGALLGAGFEHGEKRKFGMEIRGLYAIYSYQDSQQKVFKPQNIAVTLGVSLMF